jgi:hypothetical protein
VGIKSTYSALLVLVCCSCLVLFPGGCDSGRFDHTPPAGQGSLGVDNITADTLHVYLNGRKIFDVSDYDHEILDLDPGVYRVVIDEKSGYHSYAADTDILEGQLTILEVNGYASYSAYAVRVYYN